MTAGTGVTHSEYNPSDSDTLEFLQIWIQPNQLGIDPGYQQKRFEPRPGLQLIASPDARDGSLLLHQDASLYQLWLQPGESARHTLSAARTAYVHVVSGAIKVNGERLDEGDGATISDSESIAFEALTTSEALLFDLP
jgi:hypothetical protein